MTDILLLDSKYYNTPDHAGPIVMDPGVSNTTLKLTITIDYLPSAPDSANKIIYAYFCLTLNQGSDTPYRDDVQIWQNQAGTFSYTWSNIPASTWYIKCYCYYANRLDSVPIGAPTESGLSVPNITGRVTAVSTA